MPRLRSVENKRFLNQHGVNLFHCLAKFWMLWWYTGGGAGLKGKCLQQYQQRNEDTGSGDRNDGQTLKTKAIFHQILQPYVVPTILNVNEMDQPTWQRNCNNIINDSSSRQHNVQCPMVSTDESTRRHNPERRRRPHSRDNFECHFIAMFKTERFTEANVPRN
jgi:hypothetical protein